MKRLIFLGVISMFFFVLSISFSSPQENSSGYIKEGQSVYWESSFGKLTVMPHTSYGFLKEGLEEHIQFLELTWYKPDTELDFAFQLSQEENLEWRNKKIGILKEKVIREDYTCQYDFNYTLSPNYFWCFYQDTNGSTRIVREHGFDGGSLAEKTAWWNRTIKYYKDVSSLFEHMEYNNNHYYFIKNIAFKQDETKKAKIEYSTYKGSEGKWALFIKRSSDTIQQAIQNNNYVRLDPWWASSDCSNVSTHYDFWESGDIAADGSTPSAGDLLQNHGWTRMELEGDLDYNNTLVHAGSLSIASAHEFVSTKNYKYIFNSDGNIANGTIEGFFYDDLSASSNWHIAIVNASGGGISFPITTVYDTNYSHVGGPGGYVPVQFARSQGWHKVAIHWDENIIQFSIDDINLSDRVSVIMSMGNVTLYGDYCPSCAWDDLRLYNGTRCLSVFSRSTLESFSIAEFEDRRVSQTRDSSQPAIITDYPTKLLDYSREIEEPVSIIKKIARKLNVFRYTKESINITDYISRFVSWIRGFFQSIGISESTPAFAGNLKLYNLTNELCNGECDWVVAMLSNQERSKTWSMNNTGSHFLKQCNATLTSDFVGETWYSFNYTNFTLQAGQGKFLVLTFTNPDVGSYTGKLNIECDEDSLDSGNQPDITLEVSAAPAPPGVGGGVRPEPPIPPELNLTLIPPQILQSFIPYQLLYKKNASYSRYVRSNFEIKSAEAVNLENFTVEIIANSTVLLSYNLFRGNYFSKQLGGKDSSIRITDVYNRVAYVTPVSIVAVNLNYEILRFFPVIIFIPLLILVIIFAYLKRDVIKKKFKRYKKELPFSYPY